MRKNHEIPDSFCGTLVLHDEQNTPHDYFFSVNGFNVEIIPCTDDARKFIDYLDFYSGQEKHRYCKFVFGKTSDGQYKVAFLLNGFLNYKFKTSIILMGISIDISTFNAIEFRGGIVNILHPVDNAFNNNETEDCRYESTSIKDKSEFTKTFKNVQIEGEEFDIEYSIRPFWRHNIKKGQAPSFEETVSFIRFDFSESKKLLDIKKYCGYVLKLFQFCSMAKNTGFDIRLYTNDAGGNKMPIHVKYKSPYNNYIQDELDIYKVVFFKDLGDKFRDLFTLLNDTKKAPALDFSPETNEQFGQVGAFDIITIINSLEREYALLREANFLGASGSDIQLKEASCDLHGKIISLIDNESCSGEVKTKAKNLIGNLKGFEPSQREKIQEIYSTYEQEFNKIVNTDAVRDSNKQELSRTNFIKMVGEFVRMRGTFAHTGIKWNESTQIYKHLIVLIYFSILCRAGYERAERIGILERAFHSDSGRFGIVACYYLNK